MFPERPCERLNDAEGVPGSNWFRLLPAALRNSNCTVQIGDQQRPLVKDPGVYGWPASSFRFLPRV